MVIVCVLAHACRVSPCVPLLMCCLVLLCRFEVPKQPSYFSLSCSFFIQEIAWAVNLHVVCSVASGDIPSRIQLPSHAHIIGDPKTPNSRGIGVDPFLQRNPSPAANSGRSALPLRLSPKHYTLLPYSPPLPFPYLPASGCITFYDQMESQTQEGICVNYFVLSNYVLDLPQCGWS